MLSVACDITAFAQNRFGGIARVCYHTVSELSKYDSFAVTAYLARGETPEISGVTVKRLRPWTGFLESRYDIVHSLCHRRLDLKAKLHVYTVHDVWSLESNSFQSPEFQQKLGTRMRREISLADLVLTDSLWTRSQLIRFALIEESKCIALPVGVLVPDPAVIPTVPPSGFTVDGRPYVLFVGRLENRKNLPHILDALRPLRNFHLVLVGEPGYGYEENIKPLLASFPADRLTSLSRISESELLWLYRHALVTLQPSWEEGFGLPILESMAAGCPVITSNRGAMLEVAGDAAMLVDPGAPEQSRLGIERLLADAPYRMSLIEAGRRRAEEFTWRKYGEKLAAIYQALPPGA